MRNPSWGCILTPERKSKVLQTPVPLFTQRHCAAIYPEAPAKRPRCALSRGYHPHPLSMHAIYFMGWECVLVGCAGFLGLQVWFSHFAHFAHFYGIQTVAFLWGMHNCWVSSQLAPDRLYMFRWLYQLERTACLELSSLFTPISTLWCRLML